MKQSGSVTQLAQARVLIVDDVPENLTVLGELLRVAGCQVRVANNGLAALRLARQTPVPELILLDVMMPGMDGYQVLQQLQADTLTRDIPVMFLTALDDPRDEEYGLGLGAADYLAKPIQPAVVLARVRTQIDASRLHGWLRDQNAALEAEVARRMSENDAIQQVTIRALAHLAETRDPETGNHILRTQAYMALLARSLMHHPRFAAALNEHTIELLTRSAPLHDIGKVGIPDHILLKPGRLTAEEWEPMKTHAALGSEAIAQAERDIARPVEFLLFAKQIARHHHERWDGGGYPDGLAGEAIPMAARLMAVADVFDALISPRIYKRAFSFEEARRLISEGSGSHFDPAVVEVFEQQFAQFVEIAQRHRDALVQQVDHPAGHPVDHPAAGAPLPGRPLPAGVAVPGPLPAPVAVPVRH